jgi:hypothetical protein
MDSHFDIRRPGSEYRGRPLSEEHFATVRPTHAPFTNVNISKEDFEFYAVQIYRMQKLQDEMG